jgi:hypothetical protein
MPTILQEAAAGRVQIVPWTVDSYRRTIETGSLPEDSAVELVDGFLVRKDRAKAGEDPMTIGDRHRVAVLRLAQLAPAFERFSCFLQTQQPISLPPLSLPEPDGAVARGGIDDYLERPPDAAEILSVIEVADSSLPVDVGAKLRAYASAGIPQYIVVDLVNGRVLVHEGPQLEYARTTTLTRGSAVPISTGSSSVDVAAGRLLP